ncbi:MAG: efflux RND transporter periplasmic adaptor subunit [Thermoanaerobaculia bacterium]
MQLTKRRVALLGGVAGVMVLTGLAFRPKPVAIEIAVVRKGALMTTVDEDARTRVLERYEISSPIAGHHMRIDVHPGDAIERGGVLVRIEAAPLDPRQTEELQSRLRAADDLAGEAGAALRRAGIQAGQAEREHQRIAKLAASGIASASDLDQARSASANWKRDVQAARSRLNASRHNAEVIRASLAAGSPGNPGMLAILSPIRGHVLTVHRESEATITAGVPILDVGDLSTLEIVIDVLSREAVRIATGQDVIIDGWGDNAPLRAKVSRIEPSAFTKVSALGIEEQRVNVIATLEDPPPSLGDRFEVQAHVVVWSGTGLKVPSTAVFRDGERWAVFAVRNGRARLQPVTVGHRSAEEVEITSGLPPGAAIINHPSDQIRNGVRVVKERG